MSLLARQVFSFGRSITILDSHKGFNNAIKFQAKLKSTLASSISTASYSKVAPAPLQDTNLDDELANLGRSREKLEVDGIKLNWDKAGNGPHTVLCLPGIIGCIQVDYGVLFRKMNKDKFTIVSWDPPGYGLSRPPDRDFSGEFYRKDAHLVVKLMEKLGYDKFSILGWSNGGVTGGYLAADFPDRVEKLVTWGAHAYADERAVMFSRMMGNLDMWSEKMKAPMLAMYGEEYLLKLLKDWADNVEAFYNKGEDSGFKDGLPKIKCPTLLIHGEEDPVLGVEHAEFMHKHIKNSTLYVMPKAKHNLHLRFTDEFLALVEKFLCTNNN